MIFRSVLGAQKDGHITQTRSLSDPGPSCNSKNFAIYNSFPLSRYSRASLGEALHLRLPCDTNS